MVAFKLKTIAPVLVILITLGTVGYFVSHTVHHTGGFNYPLDDTYIHMAIAKNFSQNMVWGVSSYQFSSATSSPLFSLLLSACFFLFGDYDLVPLILNLIFAAVLIFVIWYLYLKQLKLFTQLLILGIISFFAPLYALVLSGMEHMLHILLVVLYMYFMNLLINNQLNRKHKRYYLLFVVAALICLARYESMTIIIFTSFVLFIVKNYKDAFINLFCGLLPIFIYGSISKLKGEMFIPNSIVGKSSINLSTLEGVINKVNILYQNFFNDAKYIGFLFLLILMSVIIQLYLKKEDNAKDNLIAYIKQYYIQLLVLVTIVAHLTFGGLNWYYRYESYLIVMAIIACIPLFRFVESLWVSRAYYKFIVIASIISISLLPSATRFAHSISTSSIAMINIYHQHIQMAKFVKKYYYNACVALNDIGAVAYYSDIKLLDLIGLADSEILMAKMIEPRKPLFTRLTSEYKPDIAIIYTGLYKDEEIPDNWLKVGQWEVKNAVIFGGTGVSFYAIGESNYDRLVTNFNAFKSILDPNVTAVNFYD